MLQEMLKQGKANIHHPKKSTPFGESVAYVRMYKAKIAFYILFSRWTIDAPGSVLMKTLQHITQKRAEEECLLLFRDCYGFC